MEGIWSGLEDGRARAAGTAVCREVLVSWRSTSSEHVAGAALSASLTSVPPLLRAGMQGGARGLQARALKS